MSVRDKFIDLQRFVIKNKRDSCFIISYDERRNYYEKLMYYSVGANIASLDIKRMPFFKMKSGITYRARASGLGHQILNILKTSFQLLLLMFLSSSAGELLRMKVISFGEYIPG